MNSISMRRAPVAAALSIALASLAVGTAGAQTYPTKNVTIIVPYVAGGSIDVMTRSVAQRLTEQWGKNVVVDNRPGASGMIGTEVVVKAPADGYLLLGHTSSYPATAAVRAKLPFDPARAIVPVATFGRAPNLLAIHPSVPAKTVKELVELAKKTEFNYGSSGTGGNNHFSGALFAAAAGVKMNHVPYKGIAPAVTALASGEVEIVIASAAALNPQIRAGRVRLLGVTTLEPSPLFPNLPSIAQSGVPGYQYELWWGLFAAAGTPQNLIEQINADVNKALASPELQKFIANEGATPWPQTVKQLDGMLVREIERYKKAAQIANIPPQ
jgi:tripartite-type tricarboxylate transporter receptor subunit TctC